jgi:hypothetical protein
LLVGPFVPLPVRHWHGFLFEARERREVCMEKSKVTPDWRLVKLEQKHFCDSAWLAEKEITSLGTIYLIDANLHVYICSLTPALEAWPVQSFSDFATPEAADRDEGEAELESLMAEEDCSYFGLDVLRSPSISAEKYIPEREEGETDEEYRIRCADEVREHLAGNPVDF